jgi:exodeoxyribonuclease VII small subunit
VIILSNLTGGRTLGYFYGFSRHWSQFPAKASFMAKSPDTAANPATTDPAAPSFERALAELESIVTAMEAGQMPLQESLDAYQRGVQLLRQCRDTLSAAEQQIRILEGGELRDFDPQRRAAGSDKPEG